jgi:hypothetical protein
MITDSEKKAIIIHNASFAETQRLAFELIWSNAKKPTMTSAPKTYD